MAEGLFAAGEGGTVAAGSQTAGGLTALGVLAPISPVGPPTLSQQGGARSPEPSQQLCAATAVGTTEETCLATSHGHGLH